MAAACHVKREIERELDRLMMVALARKLQIALWQFKSPGVVPKGALRKAD